MKFRMSNETVLFYNGATGGWGDFRRVLPLWHPNQLRHAMATELRRVAGLDAARVVLGHRWAGTTEIYAEPDVKRAAELIMRLG
jgi:hypothetical protein